MDPSEPFGHTEPVRRRADDAGSAPPSLPEVHASVVVPVGGSWFRRFLAFAGPGYMVSVGYMDPGNWATDIAGGSQFGYTLLVVILLSNLMAILLQSLAARLGIATGRDLAQACRESYPRPVGLALWFVCELAIIACDLAEVIGTAIALNLLFGIPLIAGAVIAGVGGGHVPELLVPAVSRLSAQMPVVLASRPGAGASLTRTYGYVGGEIGLLEAGLLPAGVLDARKARIALTLALSFGVDPAEVFAQFR